MDLKKISSVNDLTFIIDDMSSDRDIQQKIYRGDNLLLSRRRNLDSITPFFSKDVQIVKYENVLEISEPIVIEKEIFLTLKSGEELTNDQKSYIKNNYVK